MYLVIGLGNPGLPYESTRHNIGFMVLNRFAEKLGIKFRKGEGPYFFAAFSLEGYQILLIKPITFMNLSGDAVKVIIEKRAIYEFSNILVVLDDIDLPFGEIRLRKQGSSGGHKGLESIINSLGTLEIPRLRIGIGNNYEDAVQFVLSNFNENEIENISKILDTVCEAIETYIKDGIEVAMSKYNKNLLQN